MEPLFDELGDDDPYVRDAVVVALARLRAVEQLINVLNDRNERLFARKHVAEVLGSLGDSRAVGPLMNASKDEELAVRHAAAEALTKIRADGPDAQQRRLEFLEG